ncbi:unnamed protein product [Discosporangium mesarthrocarpum]
MHLFEPRYLHLFDEVEASEHKLFGALYVGKDKTISEGDIGVVAQMTGWSERGEGIQWVGRPTIDVRSLAIGRFKVSGLLRYKFVCMCVCVVFFGFSDHQPSLHKYVCYVYIYIFMRGGVVGSVPGYARNCVAQCDQLYTVIAVIQSSFRGWLFLLSLLSGTVLCKTLTVHVYSVGHLSVSFVECPCLRVKQGSVVVLHAQGGHSHLLRVF